MPDKVETACSHCGGTNIVRAVHVGKTAEAGDIGLNHQTAFIITGPEPFFADLCDTCGTIVRFYVRKVGKRWNSD